MGGKPWALEPKTPKRWSQNFGVSRDSSIDGKLEENHIDRAPIDAPQQGVFRCGVSLDY